MLRGLCGWTWTVGLAALLCGTGTLPGQEGKRAPEKPGQISIAFLPPPLETATYSLGIYEAKSHQLVRHLCEMAPASEFTAGLNGLITSWDGRDDTGKPVPPGRYNARGYAVGALKVEGKDILGNDWAADDDTLRINSVMAIALVPEDDGLALVATTPDMHLLAARYTGGEKNELRWQKIDSRFEPKTVFTLPNLRLGVTGEVLILGPAPTEFAYRLADGSEIKPTPADIRAITDGSAGAGKDGTVWKIEEGVLGQYAVGGERLRSLAPREGEPVPVAVAASKTVDRLYLLEQGKHWQRVRGLSWQENAQEGDRSISTWATFFEKSIRPEFTPGGGDAAAVPVTLTLVENPLSPGKPERLKITAVFDKRGGYLATVDGLRLRQISQRSNLYAARLVKPPGTDLLTFYQSDGAAWDEFSIEGAHEMMGFDAGDIEMTASGEKAGAKAVEPDL